MFSIFSLLDSFLIFHCLLRLLSWKFDIYGYLRIFVEHFCILWGNWIYSKLFKSGRWCECAECECMFYGRFFHVWCSFCDLPRDLLNFFVEQDIFEFLNLFIVCVFLMNLWMFCEKSKLFNPHRQKTYKYFKWRIFN